AVSALPILFSAVAYGPLAAMLVGASGLLLDFRRPYARWATWTSMRALSAGAAGLAALIPISGGNSVGHLTAAVALAAIVEAHTDALLAALTIRVRGKGTCGDFLRSVRPVLLATVPAYTPFIVLLVYAYREISPWSLVLFLAPAFAAHSLYKLYREQREMTDDLTAANVRLERANLSFAGALVAALDARDQYTAGHSAAVAVYARDIAVRIGLTDRQQELAYVCGLVHDVGKVGVPPGILEKPGPLSPSERRAMEEHPVIGQHILSKVDDYAEIARIVRHHHERIDGAGYPDGIRADEIPIVSRIIAVADAYNAMTSARPYRAAMSSGVARARLHEGAGSQFDAEIALAFDLILRDSRPEYAEGVSPDFEFAAQRAGLEQGSSLLQVASVA
ncbi:MAG TPA: HD domain-containing phosphohydrolase, partial [Gaiellaceae bacterium]